MGSSTFEITENQSRGRGSVPAAHEISESGDSEEQVHLFRDSHGYFLA
jgi:hypothetical protein